MRILDLLRSCPFEDVEKELQLHYNNVDTEKFYKLYRKLNAMTVKEPLEKEWYLGITVRRMSEDGTDPAVDVSDEKDMDIYYDVSGYEKGGEILYAIGTLPYEEFIQYHIDGNTLKKFLPESILAHALWEITSLGFEDID